MPGGQVSEGNGVGIRIQAFFNGLLRASPGTGIFTVDG
jgi:hypothetical protein